MLGLICGKGAIDSKFNPTIGWLGAPWSSGSWPGPTGPIGQGPVGMIPSIVLGARPEPPATHFRFNHNIIFYRAMHDSAKRGLAIACRLSVRPSVALVDCDHIG